MFSKIYYEQAKYYYDLFLHSMTNVAVRGVCIYMLFIIIHYISANLYPYMCSPLTIMGFVMSPFMVMSPHCEGLRWVIYNSGIQIRNMWIWVAGYLIHFAQQILFPKPVV